MIQNFGDKRTKQIFEGTLAKRLDAELQKKALRRLQYINAADNIKDLIVPPSNRLEMLQDDLKNYYSIRVNNQWCLIFRWENNNTQDVKFIDYN